MATARQVTELIRSYVEGSESRFRAIALQIAASEAQSGHSTVADQIRSYLDQPAKPHRPELVTGAIPLALPRGEMSAILSYSEPKIRLNELVLEDELERNLTRVVVEQRNRRKLEAKGLL